MTVESRVGEVIESCTNYFVAQCYELYQYPAFGSLVKTRGDSNEDIFGVVSNSLTSGIEPGRRPIARGRDEVNEDEIYRANPQLMKLLKSDYKVLVIGFRKNNNIFQYLPSKPARIHSFVFSCTPAEIVQFSSSLNFLNILLKSRLDFPVEELVAAVLREMAGVQGDNRHLFLVSAGKELANLLSQDFNQLKAILAGLKNE